ncbi:uncharacterized protein LOC119087952 [Peromyscus leucopus]|uniref:uncharacterized protein LOC119087952 n=1 Tax=Peromyscus leucopus TaxID=10041 RepID=UPI001885506D|nr:uncharacterized protein LOC119087952 [Peromyscus leucopus]
MEAEFPWTGLCDLPPACREMGSRLSISTIVDAMCCLDHMAEETLGLRGTNRLNDALAKNTMFNKRKSGGTILGEIWHVPKTYSFKSPAGSPSLPPTLRRGGSQAALPTLVASEDHKGQDMNEERYSKISSRSSSPDLYKLLDLSWPGNSAPRFQAVQACNINKNFEETESTTCSGDSDTSEDDLSYMEDITSTSAPQDDGVEAEIEETGNSTMLSHASLSALFFLEDTHCQQIPGPQDDAEVTNSFSTSRDLKEIDLQPSERTHDAVDSVDSPQNENTEYENSKGIILEESPPSFSKDQPQKVATASKKKQRRGWKGVRRQISHLTSSLFCCLLPPKTGDTTPT